MQAIVVIPVYKAHLTPGETRSLRQCLSLLKEHPIVLVTHATLDTTAYEVLFTEAGLTLQVESFPQPFFSSVQGYNQLMLSRSFYQRFTSFEYLFVYQLDGFVFSDQLADWCRKGYDFIGAPVFRFHGSYEAGNRLWKVGNGGVSLRKTASFLALFDQPMPMRAFPFFVKNIRLKGWTSMLLNTALMGIKLLLYNHSIEYYLKHHCDSRINEDMFWCDALSRTNLALKVPSVQVAALFCFEKSPAYLYTLTNQTLPFCCHAFERYDYTPFWKQHITIN